MLTSQTVQGSFHHTWQRAEWSCCAKNHTAQQMNLPTEQKQIHRLRANLWLLGGMGEGIDREFGMVVCTELYLNG